MHRARARAAACCVVMLISCACSRTDKGDVSVAAASTVPAGVDLNRNWDWHGVIGTGQSLAVGTDGTPPRSTAPSYRNLKLDLGWRLLPARDSNSSRLTLVPLREPIRPLAWRYPGPYPRNIFGESPHTAMASAITALFLDATGAKGDYVTVHTVVGESGQGIDVIAKSARTNDDQGHAYAATLFEARAITRLAKERGRSYGVSAIVLTHGETDAESSRYAEAIHRLWLDYNTDLKAITGQRQSIPLLLTQQSSCPLEAGRVATSALQAWSACRTHAPDIVCTGPRYQYSYVADGVHLDALGYARLGEKYGQVYFERNVRGVDWQPLAPLGVERDGNVVAITFHVPVPPLVWDEAMPAPATRAEWAKGRGFELTRAGKPLTIEKVEISGHRVLISYAAEPGPVSVGYAVRASADVRPTGSRRWGQLRDSDPFVGATTKTAQPNYAMMFELEVP